MNRISSLKHRTAAGKHRGDSSPLKSQRSSELIQASLDRLAAESEHGRCTNERRPIDADARGSNDKTPARSRSSSSIPNNHSYCASTVDSTGSTNHSSIFSKSDDSTHDGGGDDDHSRRDTAVKGGYVPTKKTLGLELVASPSLLKQVLVPPSSESTADFRSGSSAGGGSTIRSKSSLRDKTMDPVKAALESKDDPGEDDQEEEDNAEEEYDATDDIFDDDDDEDEDDEDDSEYTAMKTVADESVVSSESLSRKDDAADDTEIREAPCLRPSLSMTSAKSSEGMEVADYFNAVWENDDDDSEDDDDGEEDSSTGQPFDEGNATIMASSKAEAIAAMHSNQPLPCLKPSSFTGQRTNLPSPAVVQDRRVGRAARLAKTCKTSDKCHVDVTSSNALPKKKNLTITNTKQKTGEAQVCYTAPVVSFAENLEETHPMDEIKNDLSKDSACPSEKMGHHSPTGVQELFSLNNNNNNKINNKKHPNKGQDLSSVDSGNSGLNSSPSNRLARNREALKSVASARVSAKDVKSKKSLDDDDIDSDDEMIKDVNATPPEEVVTPPIVQSVSELDIPQFCPSMDANASKEESVHDSFPSGDGHDEGECNQETPQDEDGAEQSPSIELDASALLETNTSLELTSTKKKRFLPRLRLKSKGNNSTTAVAKQTTSGANSNKHQSGSKISIRSKFFKSKSSSKKSEESKKEDTESNKAQALDLEKIKRVDKSTALLSLPEQKTFTQAESQKDSRQMLTPGNNQPLQKKQKEPPLPKESVDAEKEKDEVPTRSITIQKTQSESSGTAAVIEDIQVSAVSTRGMSTSDVIETSFISADKEVDKIATEENTQTSSLENIKPASSVRARSLSTPSSSSKLLKAPLHSTSSLHSSSLTKVSLEPTPIESKSRSTPPRARSMDTHEGAPLLDKSNMTSSTGGQSESIFADITDFGASSFDRDVNQSLETSVDIHLMTNNFGDEVSRAQIQKMFPEFGNPLFVATELNGEDESGVEVEWSKGEVSQNKFWDESVVLDTTAISTELEQPESKWENGAKGDDISWPSDFDSCNQKDSVVKKRPGKGMPLKIVQVSQGSETDNAFNPTEETSSKSDCTKSSSLHPRVLFRGHSKDHRDNTKPAGQEETLSTFKRVVSSEKSRSSHSSGKGMRDRNYKSRRVSSRNSDDEDCCSVDEDSEDYSSEEESSDDQENVVVTIATSFQKGFTGIVDMMENAFAFGHTEETADYESESSESEEDDDDSYIQRKMARRRYKQRKLLQDARRRSQAHHSRHRRDNSKQRSGERQRVSKSSKYSKDADGASIVSEEDESHRGQRYKSSRRQRSSSGRGGSRHRVESRHRDSRR